MTSSCQYQTFEGHQYILDVELTDEELNTLEVMKSRRLLNAIRHHDDRAITVEKFICNERRWRGTVNLETKQMTLSSQILSDLPTARHTYLHELTHITLAEDEWYGHDIVFFTIFGVMLMRSSTIPDLDMLNRLRYYDLQDATIDGVIVNERVDFEDIELDTIQYSDYLKLRDVYRFIIALAFSETTIEEIKHFILYQDNTLIPYL